MSCSKKIEYYITCEYKSLKLILHTHYYHQSGMRPTELIVDAGWKLGGGRFNTCFINSISEAVFAKTGQKPDDIVLQEIIDFVRGSGENHMIDLDDVTKDAWKLIGSLLNVELILVSVCDNDGEEVYLVPIKTGFKDKNSFSVHLALQSEHFKAVLDLGSSSRPEDNTRRANMQVLEGFAKNDLDLVKSYIKEAEETFLADLVDDVCGEMKELLGVYISV